MVRWLKHFLDGNIDTLCKIILHFGNYIKYLLFGNFLNACLLIITLGACSISLYNHCTNNSQKIQTIITKIRKNKNTNFLQIWVDMCIEKYYNGSPADASHLIQFIQIVFFSRSIIKRRSHVSLAFTKKTIMKRDNMHSFSGMSKIEQV